MAVAVWAEPEATTGDRVIQALAGSLAVGGRLCVLLSGALAHDLPESGRAGEGGAMCSPGLRATARKLRQAGFAVQVVYGFHGPESLAWGMVYRALQSVGRCDLADRALRWGRACYVVHGWQAHLAPVRVLLATRAE